MRPDNGEGPPCPWRIIVLAAARRTWKAPHIDTSTVRRKPFMSAVVNGSRSL